ncbi:hypothetical protein RRG08_064306 [Elysia crispata]|uniref:Uncharacterized protein n=1 Tax=Elysia crispata TaxID=231223 RepID=A0AAE1B4I0_9GAST|nr:hypothetical protein RRG08_064306 [Elysia crispata]
MTHQSLITPSLRDSHGFKRSNQYVENSGQLTGMFVMPLVPARLFVKAKSGLKWDVISLQQRWTELEMVPTIICSTNSDPQQANVSGYFLLLRAQAACGSPPSKK